MVRLALVILIMNAEITSEVATIMELLENKVYFPHFLQDAWQATQVQVAQEGGSLDLEFCLYLELRMMLLGFEDSLFIGNFKT